MEITAETWNELERRYPGAYAYLIGQSLKDEKRHLEQEITRKDLKPGRRAWIEKRLRELSWKAGDPAA